MILCFRTSFFCLIYLSVKRNNPSSNQPLHSSLTKLTLLLPFYIINLQVVVLFL